ncbi:amidase signature domain-containing protein [Mycena galericulata]|nr:amidase signature domain-containing protein [Mycena galericulata]
MDASIIWPQAALDAVAERDARIPQSLRLSPSFIAKYPAGSDVRSAAEASGLLTELELEITGPANDATAILERIKSKELTSVQIVTAFGKRAAIAHQLLSCSTDFFLDEALVHARELDEYYERTGSLMGPLHGLPISIKDHMDVAGHKSGLGFSGDTANPPATTHGTIAQVLANAGAVFYCKTNLPQSAMHLETYSFWGQVVNPYNTRLTAGGSSGGCSALVAFGGSPLSIGSDIGGSLRSPSAACGLWTLKPTTLRVPRGPVLDGDDSIVETFGPQCKSLRDVNLWFTAVIGSEPWHLEHELVPLPWRMSTPAAWSSANRPMRIGVMWHDGVVLPQPPIRRALQTLVDALKKDPVFKIIDYAPSNHLEASELAHELYFPDGGARVRARAAVNGEPLVPLTEWVITRPTVKAHTLEELWELHLRREKLRAQFLAHYQSQNVDVVLCPVGPGPAPLLGTSKYWGYTNVWNFVDYPAAVFPTGLFADPALDGKDSATRTWMSEADRENAELYEPEAFAGAPLALQLVSRRFGDETIIQALQEISGVLSLV